MVSDIDVQTIRKAAKRIAGGWRVSRTERWFFAEPDETWLKAVWEYLDTRCFAVGSRGYDCFKSAVLAAFPDADKALASMSNGTLAETVQTIASYIEAKRDVERTMRSAMRSSECVTAAGQP